MLKKDLSAYRQARFIKSNKCPICGHLIFDNEEFEMEVLKTGHAFHYKFYHRRCYNGKEKAAAKSE